MKTLRFILLLWCIPSFSFGADRHCAFPLKNAKQVSECFAQGLLPDNSKLNAWYSGRCFLEKNPYSDFQHNAILIPTVGDDQEARILPFYDIGKADDFDNLDQEEIKKIINYRDVYRNIYVPVFVGRNELLQALLHDDEYFRLKEFQGVYFAWYGAKPAQIWNKWCYFFKKVYDQDLDR